MVESLDRNRRNRLVRRFLRVLMNTATWSLGIIAGIFLLFNGIAVSEWPKIVSQSMRDAFLPPSPRLLAEFDLSDPQPSPDLLPAASESVRSQPASPKKEVSAVRSAPSDLLREVRITQLSAGVAASGDEFIELYNPHSESVPLTGWSLRKKDPDGGTDQLVSKIVFEGKTIPARSFFLLVNAGGYLGSIPPDGRWAKSNTLVYHEHALVLRDAQGRIVDEVILPALKKGVAAWRVLDGWSIAAPAPRNSFVYN